jgi:hypothetical protein
MQLDVKETHAGDLRYFKKIYWMCIVDYETGLLYREPALQRPNKSTQREFVKRAEKIFIENWNISFLSVQMDNDPCYKAKPLKDNIAGWLNERNITHINIPKGEKEYNGKIENTNRHIDYELLPLIYNASTWENIVQKTIEYDRLHNYQIPRQIKRRINGHIVARIMIPIERWDELRNKQLEYDWTYLEKWKN